MKFIVPFGPGAGADIGGRLFAEKLTQKWGHPVVIENKPGGDSIVAIQAFLSANDDHVLLFGPSGNFTVHPFNYSKLSYNPADLIPIARASNTLLAAAVKADAPYNNVKEFTEAVRANPGKFNYGAVPGITEFTFWGYAHSREAGHHAGALPRHQRGAGRSRRRPHPGGDGVLRDRAAADPGRPHQAVRGQQQDPHRARAGHADRARARLPSLEVEGLVGLFGLKIHVSQFRQGVKIAADFKAVAADGSIAERLKATGQVINVGGPKEFADAINEQRANVAATVKAIDFKPKN